MVDRLDVKQPSPQNGQLMQGGYLDRDMAHFKPLCVRFGKAVGDVAATLVKQGPEGQFSGRVVQVIAVVIIKGGALVTLPIALIETVVTFPIGVLAIKLGTKLDIKSEFYQKYAMKCCAYASSSLAELPIVLLALVIPGAKLTDRKLPLHIINTIAHSFVYTIGITSARRKLGTEFLQRTGQLPKSIYEDVKGILARHRIHNPAQIQYFGRLIEELGNSPENLENKIEEQFQRLNLTNEKNELRTELLECYGGTGIQEVINFHRCIEVPNDQAHVINPEYEELIRLIQQFKKYQNTMSNIRVRLDFLRVDQNDFLPGMLEIIQKSREISKPVALSYSRFLFNFAGEKGDEIIKELITAARRDLYQVNLQVPERFGQRHREEIHSLINSPNLNFREPETRREALRIGVAYLTELGLLQETEAGSNAYIIKEGYKHHLYEMIKRAFIEIYQNPEFARHLNSADKSGRYLLSVFDGSIFIPLARYARFKELESNKGILCPDEPATAAMRKKLLEAKAELTELKKVAGAKEKLIQKLLNADSIELDVKGQALFNKISELAGVLHQGNFVEISEFHPNELNQANILQKINLMQRACQAALAEVAGEAPQVQPESKQPSRSTVADDADLSQPGAPIQS